ncbi:magnesium transporter [Candidatus Solincola tengchongensis]|uniref:magnesium transporter n=1 Tax=Candidatus Solincola tengchongensis TaxID=2900693 RepID=UPI002579FF63|nr:magnesium transporter [Candidatus Solincola tengchongensis]
MYFFSELQEKKVLDKHGRLVGKLQDIAVKWGHGFPRSESLQVYRTRRGRRETAVVPWEWVSSLSRDGVTLSCERDAVWKSEFQPEGLWLGRNLLDRQIVDLNGYKVVRVNDLRLAESNSHLTLTGVDVSQRALLRRLGLERMVRAVARLGIDIPERTIPWNFVAPLEVSQAGLRLTVTQSQLGEMHPTDLADILEQLDAGQRGRLLDLLDAFTAAQSLSEVEPEMQAEVIEGLAETRASNLLEIMPPDEAADILGHLPRDKAERLLNMMGVKEAKLIRDLLGYAEDTAGGKMTPEFLAVLSSYTAGECIDFLRRKAPDAETLYYVYVVDDEGRLKGVVSLRDLLTVDPEERVEEFMRRDVISVNLDDDQEAVAEVMARYNLLALPVVDDDNLLKGIITVDDVIDVLREEVMEDLSYLGGLELADAGLATSLRSRLPSLAVTLLGGSLCALVLMLFEGRPIPLVSLAFFIPLVLRAAQDVGLVSQAVILERLGGVEASVKEVARLAWREFRLVFLISCGLAFLGGAAAFLWRGYLRLGLVLGFTLLSSIPLGGMLGMIFALVSQRVTGELHFVQARLSGFLMSLTSLAIYLGLATALLSGHAP